MKKVLFVLALVIGGLVKGQSISLIANPDNAIGFNSSTASIGNKIVGHYKNLSNQYQLGVYNGTSVSLIPNPDAGGAIVDYFFKGLNKLIKYNGNIYFVYVTTNTDTVLARFDGNTISLLANPSATLKPTTIYKIFNNKLYLIFTDYTNNKQQLVRYNDTSYTVFNNPDAGIGISQSNSRESFFTLNNVLYAIYSNAAAKTQICKISNNALTLLPNTISNNKWKNIDYVLDFEYKNNSYFRTEDGTSSSLYSLAKFNGDSISVIPNPSWSLTNIGMIVYQPIVYKNEIYTAFYSSGGGSNIAKYNGTSYTKITNPDVNGNQYTYFVPHNNKLFFRYKSSSSQQYYQLASFDSVNYIKYTSPDTTIHSSPIFSFKNKLIYSSYSIFFTPTNPRFLNYYNNTNFNPIPNPDAGVGENGGIDTINGKLYIVYRNVNDKYQIAYLDFNTLPLKLLSFTAKLQQNNVALNWQTTNEINVSHFNIQRSANSSEFTTIGKVNATGDGTYSFLDDVNSLLPSPLGERLGVRLYYRLEIVDKDGSKTNSEVKQIRLNQLTNKPINIFPNPATTTVNIDCKDAKQILIIDYLGRTVKQFNNPTTHQTLNTKQLNKGVYIVKVLLNSGEIKMEKLVVE